MNSKRIKSVVFHSWIFADFTLMVESNMFLCSLFSGTLAGECRDWIKLRFDPFGKTIGGAWQEYGRRTKCLAVSLFVMLAAIDA